MRNFTIKQLVKKYRDKAADAKLDYTRTSSNKSKISIVSEKDIHFEKMSAFNEIIHDLEQILDE